ncbi:hypothetical protein [Marimonas arenosa]|uniref:Uncharacterized protein n=1 Tax=Marimonas arenosa TaxID=1795305 RepID=A0AAE3WF59_9RHOB|nr:hypothetical protein [Marimonas arenosa]MDQ2091245.1 hypothetical protein [Marimonas arenosa]
MTKALQTSAMLFAFAAAGLAVIHFPEGDKSAVAGLGPAPKITVTPLDDKGRDRLGAGRVFQN